MPATGAKNKDVLIYIYYINSNITGSKAPFRYFIIMHIPYSPYTQKAPSKHHRTGLGFCLCLRFPYLEKQAPYNQHGA